VQSLTTLARPLFRRGIALSTNCPAAPEDLKRELLKGLTDFDERARREGHSSASVEESRYALCAWLDEMAFSRTPFSIGWLGHSLAVAQFQDQSAGNNFFARMTRLHQRADLAAALDIFARCILLGFKGQYQLEDPSKLQGQVLDIFRKKPDGNWKLPPWFPSMRKEPAKMAKERTGRLLVWIGAGLLTISVLLYLLMAWLSQNI